MPIKKRTPKRAEYPITPEAIAAFRKGEHLALKRTLGLKPWQGCPLDADEPDRPAWWDQDDWSLQRSLRAELEAANAG